MDIEILLSAIRQRPLLWDSEDTDYKDKNKRSHAWVEVSKVLFDDYDNQSQDQRKLIGKYKKLL
jgi:hypothetical protein